MADIDSRIKTYYQEQHLSEARLERLAELVSTEEEHSSRSTFLGLALAAGIALFAFFAFSPFNVPNLDLNIAHEIAMNHNKQLAAEYQTSSLTSLEASMDKLDFRLSQTSNLPLQGLRLQGARYCSIQGQIAAQLTLTDAGGNHYTLYQTRATEALSTMNATTIDVEALSVKLWQEGDVVFGFAGH